VLVSEDIDNDDSSKELANAAVSDCSELLHALEASSESLECSQKDLKNLNEFMFTAAALNLQDFTNVCVLCVLILSNDVLTSWLGTHFQILIWHCLKTWQHMLKAFYKDC
jgi:hypothetical protein